MTPATLEIKIVRGLALGPIVIKCYSDLANTIPVDLTGWTPYAQVRKAHGCPSVFDLAPTVTDTNEVTIEHTAEQTAAIKFEGRYFWDLIFKTPAGAIIGPFAQGPVPISSIISQATA